MPIVDVNGQELEFPDDMSQEAIKAVLRTKFPKAEPEKPSYGSRVWESYKSSVKPAAAMLISPFIGEQSRQVLRESGALPSNKPQTFAQSVNQGPVGAGAGALGAIFAPIAPLFEDVAGYAAEKTGATPQQMENVQAVMNIATPAGMRGLGKGLGKATVADVGNVVKTGFNKLPTIGESGVGARQLEIINKAKSSFETKKINSILEHVLPKETPGQIAETITQRKLGGGLRNKVIYVPKESEKFMAKVALDVGLKKGEPIVKSVQKANFAIGKEAKQLKAALEKSNVVIEPAKFNQIGVSITEKIAKNPLIDENSATVKKILEAAQDAINSNPKTPAGVLQARIDFDKAITKFQPTAFNQDAPATAFRFSKDQVRQGFNQLVSDSVPDAMVKQSLAKQSSLYDIIENLGTKAGQQGKLGQGRVSRFLDTPAGKVAKYGAIAGGGAVVGGKVVGGIAAGTQ